MIGHRRWFFFGVPFGVCILIAVLTHVLGYHVKMAEKKDFLETPCWVVEYATKLTADKWSGSWLVEFPFNNTLVKTEVPSHYQAASSFQALTYLKNKYYLNERIDCLYHYQRYQHILIDQHLEQPFLIVMVIFYFLAFLIFWTSLIYELITCLKTHEFLTKGRKFIGV